MMWGLGAVLISLWWILPLLVLELPEGKHVSPGGLGAGEEPAGVGQQVVLRVGGDVAQGLKKTYQPQEDPAGQVAASWADDGCGPKRYAVQQM